MYNVIDILNINQLDNIILNNKYVIVYFTATWCKPCQSIKQYYNNLSISQEYNNSIFIKIDIDESTDICDKYNIISVPTFIIFVNSNIVEKIEGSDKLYLSMIINKYLK